MHRHPRRARRRVEQRVQDRPVGDRVAAVAHAFGFAIGRRDRSGIEMIAADHDRRLHDAAADEIVDRQAEPARARRIRARRCAPAVPGRPRARARAGSSGTAPRRPRTSRAPARRSRAMSAGSPDSAAQRNGPLPSQKSGRMYSGTNPGISKASSTPAFSRLRADVVAVIEGDRAARCSSSIARTCAAIAAIDRADVLVGVAAAQSASASASVIPVRHVAVQRVVRGRLIGDDVGRRRRARTSSGSTSAALPSSAIERAMPSRRHASTAGQRRRPGRRPLVDVPGRQAALDARRIDFDDERDAAVHRHGQRLGAAHAAEAGGHDQPAGQDAAEMPAGQLPRASRRCPAGSPACRCRSSCRPSSGRTSSGRGLRGRGRCPSAHAGTSSALAMMTRGAHGMRAEDGDRLAGLHDERLVVFEPAQRGDDRVERLPAARGAAGSAVDDRDRPGARRPRDRDCSSASGARLPAAIPCRIVSRRAGR